MCRARWVTVTMSRTSSQSQLLSQARAVAADYNFAATGISSAFGRAMDLLASRFVAQNPAQKHRNCSIGLVAAIGPDNSHCGWQSLMALTAWLLVRSFSTRLATELR